MNALVPLFPALRTLEPYGLPTFQDWYANANAGQAERLAKYVAAEFAEVANAYAAAIDHTYLRSDGFRANVVQAVRAAEIAESEDKLRFIARALAGCVLAYPAPAVDKVQTMRMIETLSARELSVLAGLYARVDLTAPYMSPVAVYGSVAGLTQQETEAAMLGLSGLGFLERQEAHCWKLTVLARQVALLSRLEPSDELFG